MAFFIDFKNSKGVAVYVDRMMVLRQILPASKM